MKKVHFKKFTVLVVATMLSVLLIFPDIALANDLTTGLSEVSSWADDIDAMLEGKDYVEGEVLALVNNSKGTPKIEKERKTDAEKLLAVSDTAVEETLDDVNLKKSSNAATIQIISNPEKTTKEMLLEMAKDSSVIYAQPNYITLDSDIEQEVFSEELVEKSEESKTPEIKESLEENTKEPLLSSSPELLKKISIQTFAQGTELNSSHIQDLSNDQWGYADNENDIYSVHSPKWNTTGETNVNPANKPVVAIIDSGLDITHPDLSSVLMDMTEYTSKGLPGGEYGYNCSGQNYNGQIKYDDETEADVRDNNGHGTHCAGIIAASWDGKGTSGVASGVKILPVKTSVDGAFQDSAIIRAFMYLKDAVDMGLNLYSINCSFGGPGDVGNISLIAINELGQKGVITCIASGNSTNDDDDMSNTASGECMGPYTVCVNAATPSMQATDFTCYGQSTTDVFSPGDAILSTVNPASAEYFANTDSYRVKYTGFSSEEEKNQIRIINLGQHDKSIYFEDDVDKDGKVIKSAKEKLLELFENTSKDVTGTVVTEQCFDSDNHSLEITVPGIDNSTKRQVYLVGVQASEDDMKAAGYVGIALKSTLERTQTVVEPFKYGDSREDHYNTSIDPTSTVGWLRPSKTWANHTVKYFTNLKDDNGSYVYYNGYLYFTICVRDVNGTGVESKLYIDSIGLGKNHIRYKYMQGTSMATPCITGATAVMYDKMHESGELTGLTPSQKAIKVANRMKASVNSSEDLFKLCTSGGAFDFDILPGNYTPVINTFTQNDDETFTLTGEYFGNKNKVVLNDTECEILSWNGEEIKCKIPTSIQNGRLPIYVYSDNGKIGTKKVIITGVRGAEDFEGKVKLPDEIANCKLKIAALNGVLYVVPETISPDRKQTIINKQLWAYDRKTDKWERLDDIPLSIKTTANDIMQETRIVAYNDMIVCLSNYLVSDEIKNEGGSIIMPRIYASDFYFFNPETKKWTVGELKEGIKLPMDGAIVASEKGLFYCRGEVIEEVKPEQFENSVDIPAGSSETEYTKKPDHTIYKIVFDEDAVKQSNEKTQISQVIPSGEFTLSQIQTYGSAYKDTMVIVAGSFARWYKWNEQTQKYDFIVEQDFGEDAFIGGPGQPVAYIAEYTSQMTPDGFLIAGFNGANYQKRDFDSFYRDKDGNKTPIDKFSCFADLYGLQSTFDSTEGIYYIWGSMYYGGTQTIGYLTYSKVSEPQPKPTPKPTPVDTGDHNNMMIYFICLILSGAIIVGVLLIFKKKFIK